MKRIKTGFFFRFLFPFLLTGLLLTAPACGAAAAEEPAGILAGYETSLIPTLSGFEFQLITDEGFSYGRTANGFASAKTDAETGHTLYTEYTLAALKSFWENPEDVPTLYDQLLAVPEGATVLQEERIEIDGHPARVLLLSSVENGTPVSTGLLAYARNNRALTVRIVSFSESEEPSAPPEVTLTDLRRIAEGIHYDASDAAVKQSDGAISILAREKTDLITAGRKLNLSVSFLLPEISRDPALNSITWSIIDPATGEAPAEAAISERGVLSTDRGLDRILSLTVRAESPVFHTAADYPVTVLPAVKRIIPDLAEVFLYSGSDLQTPVRAETDPAVVPPQYYTWRIAKEGIAELTDGADGTMLLKAISPGSTQLTVSEPGGKKAVIRIRVVEPVTALSLSLSGKPQPGKTVTVKAAVEPRNAGNKALEWQLNVDESIASVTKQGSVRIAKETPAGTVLTVTCKAVGAPEPVEATLEITVE